MIWTYVNGEFVPSEQAKVSVMDRGFLYGDSLFETLAAYDGRLFRLDAHLDRMTVSASHLGIPVPMSRAELGDSLYAALDKNGMRDAVLRVSLSRGIGARGLGTRTCGKPTLVILCFPPARYPERMIKEGATVKIASVRRIGPESLSPLAKTSNFLNNILAFREAEEYRADEALLLNSREELAELSVSNLFLLRAGILCTPSVECGAMAGITRAAVLELASKCGIVSITLRLSRQALHEAEEAFYTNTTATIMPIAHIDDLTYGPPGNITCMLRKEFHALIEREAGRFWPDVGVE